MRDPHQPIAPRRQPLRTPSTAYGPYLWPTGAEGAAPYALLWHERELVSVANLTRHDAETFCPVAKRAGVRTHTRADRLEDANAALADLRAGRLSGTAVLVP